MRTAYNEEYFGKALINSGELYNPSREEILEQFKTTVGVPDAIVMKKGSLSYLIEFIRKESSLSKDSGYLRLLSVMSSSFHTLPYLKYRTGMMNEDILLYGKRLSELGVLEVRNDYAMALSRGVSVPSIDIVSVEFKLSNWRSALRQAFQYKAFSSFSIVIMPSEKEEILMSNIESFKDFGIGLAVFDVNSEKLKMLSAPQKRKMSVKYHSEAMLRLYDYYS